LLKTSVYRVFLFEKINRPWAPGVNIYMENTQITIADLDTIKNVIDLATTRGAFRGAELSQVGAVYDKLSIFLETVIAQAQALAALNAEAGETQGE
jgi:hypothetical protein